MSRLRPPEDLPVRKIVDFDCRSLGHLDVVINEPFDQQNRNTCWIYASACAFKCSALLKDEGCHVWDPPELSHLCSEERLLRLCGRTAESGGDPAHALECLTGTKPVQLGYEWMVREGPVIVTSFRIAADFTGSAAAPYDSRSGGTAFRDGNVTHAMVFYGWRKTEHGIWMWRVKNSWEESNLTEVPFGQDCIDDDVIAVPVPVLPDFPGLTPRVLGVTAVARGSRLAISEEPLCGVWREGGQPESHSLHVLCFVDHETGARRVEVQTTMANLCFCEVVKMDEGGQTGGLYEGKAHLSEPYVRDKDLQSVEGIAGWGRRDVPVRLRRTGEDQFELSFRRRTGGFITFVFERVAFPPNVNGQQQGEAADEEGGGEGEGGEEDDAMAGGDN
ncbi:unnamed protein product [Vitrella brassicaformis CCMP3155]|uniref:Uncharacterized protein n=1 Tax=Vitrella brassicaformis (strain CCMP3155) TaxID=1169540 RepID=A0A0G4ERZ6_VITBC|nr:unnamed protein product [Vitrella brassicaformis CCMP3155]|eukprot:CEM00635.1 unnamed protein product [Vitrella brassicaformis CCMP3155]